MKVGVVSGDWVHPDRTQTGTEQWGGSGWVRVAQYMEYLPFDFVTGTLIWNRDHFVVKTVAGTIEYVPVIWMHRLMHNGLAENIRKARAIGQVIINDIDDWYWGLSTSNNAFKASHPKHNLQENRNNYRSILANSDLVIVSTDYLASRLDWIRCPRTVVKNTVDVTRFTPKQHVDDGLPIVGWVGSTAHRSGDLETVRNILYPMYSRGEIRLQHSGHHDTYASFGSIMDINNKGIEVITLPMTGHEGYPDILTMDIGIVPLNDTPFNRAKSDIKGLEYAAAGVPFVAQSLDAYQELYDSLGVGRLAKKPTHWIKNIQALKSAAVRQEEADRNRELIWQRDIRVGAKVMEEVISSIF